MGGASGWQASLVNGVHASVLRVDGTAYERGFAHGFLLVEQIVDFFEFFVLEDTIRSKRLYLEEFVPALRRLARLTEQFRLGMDGMIAGMRASNISLRTSLGRDFEDIDIVAMNTYSDAAAWVDSGGRAGVTRSSCSQFVFWGDA